MFDIENLYMAENVAGAVKLLEAHPQARLISGGTDVLVKLRHFSDKFRHLVSIHGLAELKEAKEEGDSLFLGAGLTFTEAMNSPLVKKHVPVLGEAAGTVAGPQIRNMGTIGGNIANGATSADTAAPMLILEPQLLIEGPGGPRTASIIGFHTGPGQVALERNEVLRGFLFNLPALKDMGTAYYKYAMRAAMDIATIGCGAGVKMEGGRIGELRLALTVAAPTPIRCPKAEEAAQGQRLDASAMKKILEALEGDIKPRTSWRATKEFRARIIKTLAERMIYTAANRAGEGINNGDHNAAFKRPGY